LLTIIHASFRNQRTNILSPTFAHHVITGVKHAIVCIVGIIILMTCAGKKYVDAARVRLTMQGYLGLYVQESLRLSDRLTVRRHDQSTAIWQAKNSDFRTRNVIAAWPESNADCMSPLLARCFAAGLAVDRQPARRIILA
jgi:hypothetical protein